MATPPNLPSNEELRKGFETMVKAYDAVREVLAAKLREQGDTEALAIIERDPSPPKP